jgi:hypothetical protein
MKPMFILCKEKCLCMFLNMKSYFLEWNTEKELYLTTNCVICNPFWAVGGGGFLTQHCRTLKCKCIAEVQLILKLLRILKN